MAKLSKHQAKKHNEALDLLQKDVLTHEDKLFIFEHYQEGGSQLNGLAGAFFTPYPLIESMFVHEVECDRSIIDLCAGIGALAYGCWYYTAVWDGVDNTPDITCVEINPEYLEIGKKILPQANWILADALDIEEFQLPNRNKYFQAISNPPFGKIESNHKHPGKYTGAEMEFKIVEVASLVANHGTFIMPAMSTPYCYSDRRSYLEHGHTWPEKSSKLKKFIKQSGIEFGFNAGFDTSLYLTQWKGVSPHVEIVTFDFIDLQLQRQEEEELKLQK